MAATTLTQQDLLNISRIIDERVDLAIDKAIDNKIEPLIHRIVDETVGGMLSDFANQVAEQFMVLEEKLEQRFDEMNIRFDRLETKLDNNIKITDRHSLEIRKLQRKSV